MREENLTRLVSYKMKPYAINYLEHKFIVEGIFDAVKKYSTGEVLDIGCGNKPYKELFEDQIDKYIGCDIIQSSNNCVDILCEATKIPLPDNSFDTVFSTQTIEHIGDFKGMVNEA